jgi:exodeoxyribonuclease V beta subunit
VAKSYAATLRELPHGRLHGFLTGVADLVAVHQGRYWLLDWKSNHLGDELADYAAPALAAAMTAHHYVLQYHLYVLALHRQLRARLRDYDCDRHFGGVCYAFLRGAAAGSASGLFVDRPPRALIEAMDRWAEGEVAR